MLSMLPTALLALLFASPVFSEPTSPNNLFRAIALQAPKHPEPPICCLKPLTPLDNVQDEILLSFEEWKAKQSAQADNAARAKEKDAANRSPVNANGSAGSAEGNGSEPIPPLPDAPSLSGHPNAGELASGQWTEVSPHFRVPLTDRFNYANLDCSARVHTAHRSAKSPSSILSSKRDRYMLSPCNSSKEKKFVVVELCDDIRIDTVQLANFEFFSGVFKDFSVSVAKTYNSDVDGWTHVGTYRAKNVRGVQSFHPPTSLRDFYRYIRIDFETHYGNEYFCPVSLLRVYGLTHLEQWKWDIWEAESRDKQAGLDDRRQLSPPSEADPKVTIPAHTIASEPPLVMRSEGLESAHTLPAIVATLSPPPSVDSIPKPISPTQSQKLASPSPSTDSPNPAQPYHLVTETPRSPSTVNDTNDQASHTNKEQTIHSTDSYVTSPSIPSSSSASSNNRSQHQANIPTPSLDSPTQKPSAPENTSANSTDHVSTTIPSPSSPPPAVPGTPSIIVSSSSPPVAVIPVIPPAMPPATRGGESIYRTIMNRLTAIESNHTLYTRYIEQQNGAIRDVIKRLGEDVGRLEGISRAQQVMYQRTFNDWEKQRYQLQMEYGDLISRIESLSEEVVLEKRLGVAQLCLLLAVLVFVGLTRGSRAETLIEHGPVRFNKSMREWGKRHFSLSSDWTNRFTGRNATAGLNNSRSRSSSTERTRTTRPQHLTVEPYSPQYPLRFEDDNDDKIAFPSKKARRKEPLETIQLNTAPISGEFYATYNRPRTGSNPRSRNTSLRSTPRRTQHTGPKNPITPTRAAFRPQPIQRSNSQGGAPPMQLTGSWGFGANVPKSAKKWARTAHLHEVKSATVSSSRKGSGGSSPVRRDHGQGHDRTPKDLEFDRENIPGDIFTLSSAPKGSAKLLGKGGTEGEKLMTIGGETEVFAESLLFKTEVAVDDGDLWEDTDSIGGSESGAEQVLVGLE
ncbi:UNC-like C-terminal-domain-containing protein [Crassisporium funariophilum]|nr:UNC-like C-terminal-domain-containing protein [Crassisporium funariophilum]